MASRCSEQPARRFSLRTRLLCMFLLASLPLAITTLAIVYSQYQQRVKQELEATTYLAHAIGSEFRQYLSSVWAAEKNVAALFSQSSAMSRSEAERILYSRLDSPDGLSDLSWLDSAGNVLATTAEGVGIALGDRSYIQRIMNGQVHSVSNLLLGRLSKRLCIAAAHSVQRNGVLVGIIVATIDINHLRNVLQVARSGMRIGLVDSAGFVVYDNSLSDLSMDSRRQKQFPIEKALAGFASLERSYTPPNSKYLRMGAAVPVAELGWAAYASAPVHTVLATVRWNAWQGVIVAFFALLLSIAGSLIVGTNIIKRIEALQHAAQQLTDGNLAYRVDLRGKDELSVAGLAFNSMAARLQNDEDELRAREERLRMAMNAAQMIVWEYMPDTGIIRWSASGVFIPGLPKEGEISYSTYLRVVHRNDRSAIAKNIGLLLAQGKEFSYEHRISLPGNKPRWLLVKGKPHINNSSEQTVIGVTMDVTTRKQAEVELRHLSLHDGLTGLHNRACLEMEMQRLDTERQLPLSLVMVDVNGLKLINDGFGHQTGDQLLVKVAEVLRSASRKEEICARWGGDEFVIFLPQTDEKTSAIICERILQAAAKAPTDPVPISLAMGYATKTRPEQDLHSVLAEAESRMYRRKLLESRSAHSSIISSLARTLRERSHETEEHARRLQQLSIHLGHSIGLATSVLDELSLAAALHDIGKVGVNDTILLKTGPLSADEWEQMRKHVEIGYRIALSSPDIAPVARAILFHHEWWDGSGYPEGLQGKAIPLLSRILAIVDAYDVMTHNRPYRPSMSKEAALNELQLCAGTQFDPYLVDQFIAMISKQTDNYPSAEMSMA